MRPSNAFMAGSSTPVGSLPRKLPITPWPALCVATAKPWKAISPFSYVDRFAQYEKDSLFIYATYDTTFLPEYSRAMLEELRKRKVDYKAVVLPCGHYTLGETPFKYLDGYHICSFLLKSL